MMMIMIIIIIIIIHEAVPVQAMKEYAGVRIRPRFS